MARSPEAVPAMSDSVLPPTIEFGRVEPVLEPNERFSLDATAIVG